MGRYLETVGGLSKASKAMASRVSPDVLSPSPEISHGSGSSISSKISQVIPGSPVATGANFTSAKSHGHPIHAMSRDNGLRTPKTNAESSAFPAPVPNAVAALEYKTAGSPLI
jgi:hypothetical protein